MAVATVGALLVLSGCGSSSSPAKVVASSSPAQLPPGAVRVNDTANKFQVTLPQGWQVVNDPTRVDKLLVAGASGPASTDPAVLAQAKAAFDQGVKLLAVDTKETPSTSNVTVLVKADMGIKAADIMGVVPSAEEELGLIDASGVHDAKVTIDGTPAAEIDYQYVPASSNITVVGKQFYLIKNGNVYIVTISTKQGGSTADGDFIAKNVSFG